MDIYNRAQGYARQRRALADWPIGTEDRQRIARYLADRIEHRSPGRRYSDILLLKRLFCGTRAYAGRPAAPPLVTKPLADFTLDDFRALRTRLQEEVANRDSFRKLADHAWHLYHRSFTGDRTKRAVLDALFQTGPPITMLDRLSGVNKNGTLYFLRHGGYTWKRQAGMNPAVADRDMGWSPGTKQQGRYLHLHDDDVLAERLRLADETPDAAPRPEVRAPQCPSCRAVNSPADDRCADCGHTLDVSRIVTEHGEQQAMIEAIIEAKLATILTKHGLAQVHR